MTSDVGHDVTHVRADVHGRVGQVTDDYGTICITVPATRRRRGAEGRTGFVKGCCKKKENRTAQNILTLP